MCTHLYFLNIGGICSTKITSYKNKKGKTRYKLHVFLGYDPTTGKKYETTRQGFTSRTEAKNKASKLQISFSSGKLVKKSAAIKTFQELFDLWFESYRQSTATDCWWLYKRYIKPRFGKNKRTLLSKIC
ncbi:Arm DNA-binding domain-containing protein [Liquorilactobacillus mali]|uniref:Arm DNA-binding domain-containing protein n=1 Tax=Liquorilactobacillus mali TaxID=1618 RepID=UPI000704F474